MYSSGGAAETSLPPLPRFKLKEVIALAKDLEPTFQSKVGQIVTDSLASRWAYEVHLATDHPLVNLTSTFQQYKGVPVSLALAKTLAWQVASRGNELDRGILLSYSRPTKPEWVACEISSISDAVWRETDLGTCFHLFALAGHPAGHVLQRKVPNTWLNWFAYQVGFSRAMVFDRDPRHFVGLRFWGFLKPKLDSPDVEFTAWELTPEFSKYNKAIIKLRTRFEHGKVECPKAFDHLCWDCSVRRSECPASCRPT